MKKYLFAALVILLGALATAVPCLAAGGEGPGVRLSWMAPKDVDAAVVTGYNVYRSEYMLGHYERINDVPVATLGYDDRGGDPAAEAGLEKGRRYYYKLTTLFVDGSESQPSEPIGMEAGGEPGTETYRLPVVEYFTSDALGKVMYAGEQAVFILKSSPGLDASFGISGVISNQPMEEVQPGTYKGTFIVEPGMKVRGAYAEAVVMDAEGGRAMVKTQPAINMLGWLKPTLTGLYVGILEADRVGINWDGLNATGGTLSVFRDTSRIVGTEDVQPLSTNIAPDVTAYVDTDVSPDTTYYYIIALVNEGGLVEAYSENVEAVVPGASHVSGIDQVAEDSGGRTLLPGDVLGVTMKTEAGGEAFFSLGDAARDIKMEETSYGIYSGSYAVGEGDGVFKARVSVSFRDSAGKSHFTNSATFVSVDAPRDINGPAPDGVAPVIFAVTDDVPTVAGRSGRLTAGKTFTVTMTGEPGNKAFFNLGEGIWKVPMREDPGSPGTYTGEYTVRPGDNAGTNPDPLAETFITGYLVSPSGAVSQPARGISPVVVDTTCTIDVDVENQGLKADAQSSSRVTFTVTDADGEPVRDRRLTVLLEPPPRYTGVIGGGGVGIFDPDAEEAANGGLGRIEVDFDDLTDAFGQVGATYTSGFAAKTAMVVARDQATGSVGMGYIVTELSASANVTLEALSDVPPGPGPVYDLVVEFQPEAPPDLILPYFMVRAIPDTLTADGRSRATVVATLTKDGIPVEGRNILFSVSGAGGYVTDSSSLTDLMGRAQTFYVAGTRAGYAIISATEAETGVSVSKTVTLLADAPAKIFAVADPSTLPADGVSTSEVMVSVFDVNDNPTGDVRLEYSLSGPGSISDYEGLTDVTGYSRLYYTAGSSPGVATINIRAVSEPPTAVELDRALSRVVAPVVYDNYGLTELAVLRWYKSQGDTVGKGEPLALIRTPLGDMKVYSPVDGRLSEIIIEAGVYVMEGREIGVIEK